MLSSGKLFSWNPYVVSSPGALRASCIYTHCWGQSRWKRSAIKLLQYPLSKTLRSHVAIDLDIEKPSKKRVHPSAELWFKRSNCISPPPNERLHRHLPSPPVKMLGGLEHHHRNTRSQSSRERWVWEGSPSQQPSLGELDRMRMSTSAEFNNTFKCGPCIFLRENLSLLDYFKERKEEERKTWYKTVAKCTLIAVIASIPPSESLALYF